jgi:hypothetical protein
MTETTTNRRNIALTGQATLAAESIREKFPFGQAMDLARFGVAYAIKKGIKPERPADFRADGTNWHVGSIDSTGDFRELVRLTFPAACEVSDPYTVVETLMTLGILQLAKDLNEDPSLRLSEILTNE